MEKRKNRNKVIGGLLAGLGAVLMVLALLLLCHNDRESREAGAEVRKNLPVIQEQIQEQSQVQIQEHDQQQLQVQNEKKPKKIKHMNPYDAAAVEKAKEMTVLTVNGNDYIGYLTIPYLELQLPVLSEWSYDRLKIAPCRQFGSTKTDNLVVAAHNYASHFGHLKELEPGETVCFTDADGEKIEYFVDSVGTISPNDVDIVKESGYDLVLYTCTYGGANRVMVGCYRL